MTLNIFSASTRQIFNISNYLNIVNTDEFEDYETVLRETYHNDDTERMKADYLEIVLDILRERNYNRDYS